MSFKEKIQKLKKQKNAVILAHNYQLPDVQDIADFTGDSLGLSIEASKTEADVIVFCGVHFMAETAKILSPQKAVLIPDASAGCPMADMITVEQLRDLKNKHPRAKVMAYVNTSAEVKAQCDYCCTSANAIQMLKEAFTEEEEVIFIPDKYLAIYAASEARRNIIIWPGYCPTHARILPEHVLEMKKVHPQAKVMVHPECSQPVIQLADAVLSTSGMIRYAKDSSAREFIVGTEVEMEYALQKELPEKRFYAVSALAICPNMKKITLDKVIHSLENGVFEITLAENILKRAKTPIKNMLNFRPETELAKR